MDGTPLAGGAKDSDGGRGTGGSREPVRDSPTGGGAAPVAAETADAAAEAPGVDLAADDADADTLGGLDDVEVNASGVSDVALAAPSLFSLFLRSSVSPGCPGAPTGGRPGYRWYAYGYGYPYI